MDTSPDHFTPLALRVRGNEKEQEWGLFFFEKTRTS